MRSILCYLLFAIGGTVTYVCAEEKEQIGSDTLENILFVVDFKVPKLKGKGIIALGVLVVIELVQILCFS